MHMNKLDCALNFYNNHLFLQMIQQRLEIAKSKHQPSRTTVPCLINCLTDWLQYWKRIGLLETDSLLW